MHPTLRLLALLAVFLPVPVAGQAVITEGSPADVGMSARVLEAGVGLYQDAVEQGELVGAVLLVAKDGTVVLKEALGWRDKAAGLPMETSTLFRMASNTKPVVATGVGMLVEAGALSFEEPVRRYIPSFDNHRSAFINVGHLLSHSSGFRIPTLFLYPYMRPTSEHPEAPTLQLEAARFGPVGADVIPGDTYSYSNPGYNTLGALIEIASEKPLEVFLDESIYSPLGMNDSYHHEVDEKMDGKLNRMSVVYYEREGGDWVPGWSPGDPPQVPFVRASGGMISTADDYVIFCQMFLNGGEYGGHRILTPETVGLMTSPKIRQNPDSGDPARYYGFGWAVDEEGVYSHSGSDGTFAWVDPSRNVIGLVFTQTPRGRNPIDRFRQIVNLSIDDRP